MTESQDEVNALVTARNLGDPMKLLPGVEQLDCTQLAVELAERRRDLDLFASQIRSVEEHRQSLSAEIATTQAAKDRRATELDAAARRASIDEAALEACLLHGIGMVNGECSRQEVFQMKSEGALRDAKAAFSAVTTSLQALQLEESEISRELLSLKADLVAIEGEINQIILIMGQKSCLIPVA
ncbi:MAG TPA: hypothetical protein VF173_35315 [Thermoanaerobaculia bacterium]|nr:hypothetical protein [Thermoanaerobaculia bacterium]